MVEIVFVACSAGEDRLACMISTASVDGILTSDFAMPAHDIGATS